MNNAAIAVIAVVVICVGIGAAVMIGNSNSNDSEITEGVIYHGNGGTNDGKTTFSITDHKVMQSLFTRDDYKFVSWNTASDGSGKTYVEGDTIDFKSGQVVNLYAMWKVIGHSITVSWTSGDLSFYYENEKIGLFGLDIPDSGTITVKITAPEGATNFKYEVATLSSGERDTVQYDIVKDGVTTHYTCPVYVYRGGEKYTPTFTTVSDGVEVAIECNNTDVSISYSSISKRVSA